MNIGISQLLQILIVNGSLHSLMLIGGMKLFILFDVVSMFSLCLKLYEEAMVFAIMAQHCIRAYRCELILHLINLLHDI